MALLNSLNYPISFTMKNEVRTNSFGNKRDYAVKWDWNGEMLSTNSCHAYNSTWGKVKANSQTVKVSIVPESDAAIEVEDNSWVNSSTKFID